MKSDLKKSVCFGFFFCVLFLLASAGVSALEITKDNVRLILHEQSGRFSLYGMNKAGLFEPLFSDEDPRASFIEIHTGKKIYRLGEAAAFKFYVDGAGETPAFVFESDDLQVREEFAFIRTVGSRSINGIQVTIRVRNRRRGTVNAGLRFLLDTSLGEADGTTPLFINNRALPGDTVIGGNIDSPWVSRSASASLMGSAYGGKTPDYLQFANWKRLSEALWKPQGAASRNFNYPPHSFNDAALCYYFEPEPLPRYGEREYVIVLALEDPRGFVRSAHGSAVSALGEPSSSGGNAALEEDLALLRNLLSRMDSYLEGKIEVSDREVVELEQTIARLKARYNIP